MAIAEEIAQVRALGEDLLSLEEQKGVKPKINELQTKLESTKDKALRELMVAINSLDEMNEIAAKEFVQIAEITHELDLFPLLKTLLSVVRDEIESWHESDAFRTASMEFKMKIDELSNNPPIELVEIFDIKRELESILSERDINISRRQVEAPRTLDLASGSAVRDYVDNARIIEINISALQKLIEAIELLFRRQRLKHIAKITHGFVGADLAALCRESAMKSLRRYLPEIDLQQEKIPPEIIDKLEIKMCDFESAYKEITPTELREVYIEMPTVRWEDVGGLEDVKQELIEAVEWPLKFPEKFNRLGIKPPKGILLYGPPGCGKTLLAKAVATESEANFITIKGPEIISKWVGESEKAIREVFRRGRSAAPAIIFFDEIDSITPMRGAGLGESIGAERVISQMLTEIDGLIGLENVVILAATNKPDLIDLALLRPGRFDRLVYVPAPDNTTRGDIFKIHTKEMPLKDVDFEKLTTLTRGYVGSDIEAICREAALIALRENQDVKEITMPYFIRAVQKVRPSVTEDLEKYYHAWEEKGRQTLRGKQPLISFA
jgi:SpoVK/Ycf46/Vps4 family AAA+-type ATPase